MRIIQRVEKRFKANDFVRGVMTLVSGTALSQITVVGLTPILTRLYSPESFGVLSVYLSIVLTIAIFASWHFEFAIPLPKEETTAIHLLFLSLIVLGVNTLLFVMTLVGLKGIILSMFQTDGLDDILLFLPFSLFGFGLFQLFEMWLLRQENFSKMTTGKVRMNLSQFFSQAVMGVFIPSADSLMAGEVIGRLAGGGGMAYQAWKGLKGKWRLVSRRRLLQTARRYSRFPLIASWSACCNKLSQHLPVLFIAFLIGAKEAGWYFLAIKILTLSDALLGYSVKQVYTAKSAKLIQTSFDRFVQLFWNTVKRMGAISLVIHVVIVVVTPFVLPIVFGRDWGEAGVFVQCLSLFYCFKLVVGPISATFNLLEEQYFLALSEVIRLTVLIGGLLISYVFLQASWQIVLCISGSQAIGCLVDGCLAWVALKHKQRRLTVIGEGLYGYDRQSQ